VPDLQPTLEGPRLTLRPLRREDWDEMYGVASDPELWAVHPERLRYEEPIFRLFFNGALESASALTIINKSNGRIIGSSRYLCYEPQLSEIEIGWTFLARP
jgi:RimJ/RimL family protein N-acetyltransferase